MVPRLQEPRSVEEAQAFIGRDFRKFFAETQTEYAGQVVDIDTEVENDQGVEEVGLFYRVEYEDGDTEHLLWEELARLLASSATKGGKKRKSTDKPGGTEQVAAKADAGQHQPASNSKRRRQAARQRSGNDATEDATEGEEAPDSADPDYETAASTVDRKRNLGKQQLPDSGARNNSRRQARAQHSPASASPDGVPGQDNDAAAGVDHGDEAAMNEELEQEMLDMEEPDDATVDRLLRENNNEVVNVRQQGLAGHIKAVQVQNFMCHQNFAIDFGTHVNVISGSNGSGKSAVLQAIQNCLGVKAKDTGRGENMKDFVRTGCHESKIQVTIWNTGDDAYRPREYGNSITVERTIKIGGARETASSKIRLLSSTNKVVSTRMADLHIMLDHLSIDASNPLAVMTQDTSRDFLCGSVADKKKYELFMKATMLADMQDNLKKAQGYVDQMKSIINELKETHMKRESRVKEVRDKLRKLEESAGLLQQRTIFERAVCWAGVESIEEQLQKVKHQVEVAKPKVRHGIKQLLEEVERELELLRQQEETLAADAEAQQATQQNFAATMQQLGEDLKHARLENRQKNQAFQKLANKLQQAQSELKTLLESTRETNDDRQREFEQRMQVHNQHVAELQQQMQAAEARAQQCEQRQQEVRAQHDDKEGQLREVQRRQQSVMTELQGHQQQLQQLQNAKGQKLAMFGPHGALRAQVDRNRRSFEKVPIGPLGAHLTLTDQSWAVAAEVVLGSHLETWLVHNSRDEQALRRMAQNLRIDRLNVMVASFDRPPYNLNGKAGLAAGWQSLRQFVRVEHPTCAHIIDNKLMDVARYDTVVVDRDESRCSSAIYNGAAGAAVHAAVHVNGRQFNKVRRAVVTKNYFGDRQPRIGQSVESSMQFSQQQIANLQVHYNSLQGQLVALNNEVQQLRREGEAAMRASRVAKGDELRTRAMLQNLQAQVPVLDPIDEEGADNMFAEQQRSLQQQIATLQVSHDRAKMELDQAHLKLEQAKQLMDDRKQEMNEAMSQATSITEELEKLAEAKAKQQRHKDLGQKKLQELEADIAQQQKRLEQLTQELEQCRNEALKACDEEAGVQALADARAHIKQELTERLQSRVTAGHQSTAGLSEEQLQGLIEKSYRDQCYDKACVVFNKKVATIEKKIASVEEDAGGSREELEHQLSLAEAEFNRHSKSYHKCKRIYEVTSAAVSKRWNKYWDLFDSVTSTVSQKFMYYMHRRGHAGRVRISSEDRELRLLVKINSQSAGAAERSKVKAVKDLKQLSGGERSFTTVAFILALGEYTECPFRAMDEFDVFMDAINRRIATQTLLQFARDKSELQFVLLTPQDLQAVEDAKRMLAEGPDAKPLPEGFVKVVQMRPPRPNQQQQQ